MNFGVVKSCKLQTCNNVLYLLERGNDLLCKAKYLLNLNIVELIIDMNFNVGEVASYKLAITSIEYWCWLRLQVANLQQRLLFEVS